VVTGRSQVWVGTFRVFSSSYARCDQSS